MDDDEIEHWRRLQRPGFRPTAIKIYDVAERRKDTVMDEHKSPCTPLQVLGERVENVDYRQQRQDNALDRLAEKLDRLVMWSLTASVAALSSVVIGIVILAITLASKKP